MSADRARSMLAMPTTRLLTVKDAFLLASIVPPEAEIVDFGVHPRARRRGQARRLMETLQAQVDAIFLEVAVTNAAAISFYKSTGFTCTGRRSDYYNEKGGYVDGLVMTWSSAGEAGRETQESVDPPAR